MAQSTDPGGNRSTEIAPLKGLEGSEKDVLIRLGAAVLHLWDRLPKERQQAIFSAAMGGVDALDVQGLRKKLALILHAHHTRTSRVSSQSEHQDDPAGPHARPHLTNYDATPGSGVLPARKRNERDVDPGAG